MTKHREPDELLEAYLAEGMRVLPDRVVDAVLDEVHRTRQRAAFGPWRTQRTNSALKLVLTAAAVVAVALAGITFLPRNGGLRRHWPRLPVAGGLSESDARADLAASRSARAGDD